MTAFATHTDLSTRMNRVFTAPEQAWVTALLEDAADFMRGIMRNHVFPAVTATYTAYPTGGRISLPQSHIRSIGGVQRDGASIDYTRRQDVLLVDSDEPADVTFTYGLDVVPKDLVQINCALVSQMMLTVEAGLGLSAGGLSSVAIDDFKAAWADAGAMSGMAITDATRGYLERVYGTSAWVVGAS